MQSHPLTNFPAIGPTPSRPQDFRRRTMNKVRAATVLGGLTMVGMLMLSSLTGAKAEQSYFYQLKGALGRACLQHATQGVAEEYQDIFRAACSFVSSTLQELAPSAGEAEIREALVDAFGEETPGLSALSSCEECVQSVSDFEAYLATNGTVVDIQEAVALSCLKQFTKRAQINQCLQNVDAANIPSLIDFTLANLPPGTACQELRLCAR
jgi:hypothetical protein